jgi:hypothetical protein
VVSCPLPACKVTYSWNPDSWSKCTGPKANCKTTTKSGVQTRTVTCTNDSTGNAAPKPSQCKTAKPVTTRTCKMAC